MLLDAKKKYTEMILTRKENAKVFIKKVFKKIDEYKSTG